MQHQSSEKGQPVSITIYSKKTCDQCTMTKKLYDRAGVTYETVNVDANEALQEKLRAQGHMSLPVIVTPTDSWAGFQPDRIKDSIELHTPASPGDTLLPGPDIA
ncbi:thioredoxin domain-containing protein [Arthrobacter pigmenti]